jgi:hypothetical protein
VHKTGQTSGKEQKQPYDTAAGKSRTPNVFLHGGCAFAARKKFLATTLAIGGKRLRLFWMDATAFGTFRQRSPSFAGPDCYRYCRLRSFANCIVCRKETPAWLRKTL